MKIGVSSWSMNTEFKMGRLDMVGFIQAVRDKFHLDTFELVNWMMGGRSNQRVREIKNALAENSVSVMNFPIDTGNISELNPEKREHDLEDTENWIDVAADLGSRFARVNPGSQPEGREDFSITVDSYKRLASYCEKKGIVLAIENHGGLSADPDYLLRLYREVNHDNFRICVDFGNFASDIRYDALERVFDYAALAHVKSYNFCENGNFPNYNVGKCIEIAKKHGYDGCLSIEYEGTQDSYDGITKTIDLVKKFI